MNKFLYRQVDAAPLAVFRMMMGILMAVEGFGAIITGWAKRNYVDHAFTFNFIGFDFLQIIVGPQVYVIYALLGIFGLMIAFGWYYRIGVLGYTILWTAVYLGQKSSYNNHYYLLMLYCFLFLAIPLNRYAAMDVKQGRVPLEKTTSYWHQGSFKLLLLIVYMYAATAKLYPDWLDETVIRIFLKNKSDLPLIGVYFTEPWFIKLLTFGGIFFDALIIPALWWRKTRIPAFIIAICFHIFNSIVFQIGIFPYMMLIACVLYFDENLIRKIFFRKNQKLVYDPSPIYPESLKLNISKTCLFLFFITMIVLPLRPLMFPGPSQWTEEGHRLSWHMMLRTKSGTIKFRIISKSHGINEIILPKNDMLKKVVNKMATHPDFVYQYVQILKKRYKNEGINDLEIYAISQASLNERPSQEFIDGKVDLAKINWNAYKPNNWIVPLKNY